MIAFLCVNSFWKPILSQIIPGVAYTSVIQPGVTLSVREHMGLTGDTSVSPEMLLVLDSDGKRPKKMLNILRHTRWSHDRIIQPNVSGGKVAEP